MKSQSQMNPERKPKKRTWRLDRPPVPSSERPVHKVAGGLSYKGLKAELRKLGYKTMSWNPR